MCFTLNPISEWAASIFQTVFFCVSCWVLITPLP
jgi:hypothetical protein